MNNQNFILVNPVPNSTNLVNESLCKRCGGMCCKQSGCVFSPDDFPALKLFSRNDAKRYLRHRLKQGKISIALHIEDNYEDSVDIDMIFSKELATRGITIFYPRMRNKGQPIIDFFIESDMIGKYPPCAILTNTGCPLPFNKRPKSARYLVPGKYDCTPLYTYEQAYDDWLPYQDIMFELVKDFAYTSKYPLFFE